MSLGGSVAERSSSAVNAGCRLSTVYCALKLLPDEVKTLRVASSYDQLPLRSSILVTGYGSGSHCWDRPLTLMCVVTSGPACRASSLAGMLVAEPALAIRAGTQVHVAPSKRSR